MLYIEALCRYFPVQLILIVHDVNALRWITLDIWILNNIRGLGLSHFIFSGTTWNLAGNVVVNPYKVSFTRQQIVDKKCYQVIRGKWLCVSFFI